MKRSAILMSILTLSFVFGIFAGDDVPKRPDFNRYSAMLNRSPFAVATAVAAPAATPNFARDLYVANAAHTVDADFVTIVSGGDRNLKEYLSTAAPNDHGYGIANIQWSDKPGETKVTISKDGQFATLPFNQALLGPGVSNAAPATAVLPPPAVNQAAPYTSLPQTPANTHVRGTIKNPSALPSQAATPYNQPPPPPPDE